MKKIVVDMQNFLFADSIATAFKNSDYDIAVVRAESPRDTIELCRVFKPFVLLMEVTAYTPWLLCERMKLRDEAKTVCPDCKIALIVDSNTEKQAAKDIREAKKNGIIDQFFYGSMTAEFSPSVRIRPAICPRASLSTRSRAMLRAGLTMRASSTPCLCLSTAMTAFGAGPSSSSTRRASWNTTIPWRKSASPTAIAPRSR